MEREVSIHFEDVNSDVSTLDVIQRWALEERPPLINVHIQDFCGEQA